MSAFWFFRHRFSMNFVCPIDVGTGDIHQQEGRVAMAEAAERESCLFLSEWEAARRENHAIRRKYTEGQLLGYATGLGGDCFFRCHDSLCVLFGRVVVLLMNIIRKIPSEVAQREHVQQSSGHPTTCGHKFQRRWFFQAILVCKFPNWTDCDSKGWKTQSIPINP